MHMALRKFGYEKINKHELASYSKGHGHVRNVLDLNVGFLKDRSRTTVREKNRVIFYFTKVCICMYFFKHLKLLFTNVQ